MSVEVEEVGVVARFDEEVFAVVASVVDVVVMTTDEWRFFWHGGFQIDLIL